MSSFHNIKHKKKYDFSPPFYIDTLNFVFDIPWRSSWGIHISSFLPNISRSTQQKEQQNKKRFLVKQFGYLHVVKTPIVYEK
jgi:hypothetical protein